MGTCDITQEPGDDASHPTLTYTPCRSFGAGSVILSCKMRPRGAAKKYKELKLALQTVQFLILFFSYASSRIRKLMLALLRRSSLLNFRMGSAVVR